ncbi:hypothetical protein CFOL_v3_21325, partial [Cephalotus follicularis]
KEETVHLCIYYARVKSKQKNRREGETKRRSRGERKREQCSPGASTVHRRSSLLRSTEKHGFPSSSSLSFLLAAILKLCRVFTSVHHRCSLSMELVFALEVSSSWLTLVQAFSGDFGMV